VDVPANLSIGLDAMPGVGLAKKEFADMVFMHVTYALVAMGWRDTDKDEGGGFNIGAILVDKTQKIIAWGLNLVSANKSFHAETLMFQAYLKRSGEAKLPDGCTMYTTLESCHMCAGFAATIGSGLRVVYGQKDNQIVNSALERKVNGTSQVLTSVAFQATGTPPVNVTVTPGPAGAVIAKLRNDYQAIYHFTGVTKFLFHDIGKYFYTVEKAMPKQMTTRIDELKKPTPSFAPAKMTSLPMLDPSKTFAPKAPLGHLDLAFPSKPIADADRDAMNKKLFGAELELANYALKFLTTLKDAGILKN
jgi:tRNA(Arg) A34 adenosine deaminase TadA